MLAPDATYEDPTTGGPIPREAVPAMISGLLTMFPDLSFDVLSSSELPDGRVAGQWIMRGTNTGPLPGGPPLGRTIALPGADFIEVEGDHVKTVTGYFDQKTLFEQMGLAVQPLPAEAIGPFSFGTGVRVSMENPARPGAFSVTVLHTRSDGERAQVSEISQNVSMDLLGMRGFIGFTGMSFGHLMTTVTAWEDVDGPQQLYGSRAHQEGIRRMMDEGLTDAGMLSVWQPVHIRMLTRCSSCGRVVDMDAEGTTCPACGAGLQPHCVYY
jgi:predicted ester cyclase